MGRSNQHAAARGDGSNPLHAAAPRCGRQVRFVGDPSPAWLQTVAQAKDAAEAVTIDIGPLPVVLAGGRSGQAPHWCSMRCRTTSHSTITLVMRPKLPAFAKAKHVTRLETSNQRMVTPWSRARPSVNT